MKEAKNIVISPVSDVINLLDETRKSTVLLLGREGSGKTTIINELLDQPINEKMPIINASVNSGEYIVLKNNKIFNLYHTCLIIQKIILYIRKYYVKEFFQYFSKLNNIIENLLNQINMMYSIDMYDERIYINENVLINTLLDLLRKVFDIEKLTLIIDDFDKIGETSQRYQEFIYNNLREYFNMILTVSDPKIINDYDKIEELKKDADIVKVNYNLDTEVVEDILDKESIRILKSNNSYDLSKRSLIILSYELVEEMINKTNGNLFNMLLTIRYFYRHINELTPSEYESFILNYIDEEINMNLKSSVMTKRRHLYIN